MAGIGRNKPCPCDSGKKFKKCCGDPRKAPTDRAPPFDFAAIDRARRQAEALRTRQLQQQGLGRPILSAPVSGERVVVVGKRLYHSRKWVTFHDFLRDYLLGSLGPDWSNAEQAKPLEQRHQILRWYAQAVADAKPFTNPDGVTSAPMTGAIQAFLNLSYNIYLIAHHGDGQAMADIYLQRLRSTRDDAFIGALFETYAAAAFLKAGFTLSYEETKPKSHSSVEFVATWAKTDEQFSVEVKSRVHTADPEASDNPVDEVKRLRVGAKLAKALGKAAAHTRVVIIEINVPDQLKASGTLEGWPAAALKQIRDNEGATDRDGAPLPPAYVFVTNHAFHHDLAGTGGNIQALAAGYRIPDFGPDVRYQGFAGVMAARAKHAPMTALIESMKTHYQIPATFDGELPSTLTPDGGPPRLKFGERYAIPDENGALQAGRFYNASVDPKSGTMHSAFELDDGRHIIAVDALSPQELAEYRQYPDTYFGEVLKPDGKCESFVDWCDWLFETYQHTPREKLLEFMANAQDIEQLKALDQRELAIAYSERLANAVHKPKSVVGTPESAVK
ncbi:MAG: SEC-C metal-binding domain-containing protein [Sphingomonas paucimobilis]